MKDIIEQVLSSRPFSMPKLYGAVWPSVEQHTSLSGHLLNIEFRLNAVGPNLFRKICYAILRKSFLIQTVIAKAGSANTQVRWQEELKVTQRYCSFDECIGIAGDLLNELASGWLDVPDHLEVLELLAARSIIPYEMPIDYRERIATSDTSTMIHRKGNLGWHCDPILLNALRLRNALSDPQINPEYEFFTGALKHKMVLLAYLTGRAQTGKFKTNREARWEADPRSYQFAGYSACTHIEHKLYTQICDFEDFPPNTRKTLHNLGLIGERAEVYSDPVTLEPFKYNAFREDVETSAHGVGNYQLGHMEPLRSELADTESFGHSAQNVSWITATGNRIQGKTSLPEIQKTLIAIAERYEEKGYITTAE